MKGMELDVKDRYASATEMLQDMDQFRMNPARAFAYGGQQTVSQDATIVLKPGEVAEAVRQSRSTAEKVAGQTAGAAKPRPQQGTRTSQQTGPRPAVQGQTQQSRTRTSSQTGRNTGTAEAARRAAEGSSLPRRKTREEIRREVREEERNRAATIAVVACSAVAIIAILIFLVVLVNVGLVGRGESMVFVPDMEGKYFEQTGSVTGLVFEIDQYVNSDEYEKGKIISHTPEYGAQVQQGTVIKVTVSLGPEPEVRTMSYMVGYQEVDARAVLTGMGMVPVAMEEFNDDIEKGKVARTDPEAGTVLTEGQTVYIYISKGPIIETAEMPKLVGLDYATAKKTLEDLGFESSNISFERKDSKADKDEVIEQPYEQGEKVDITSKIVLVISKGNKSEQPKDERPDDDVEQDYYPSYTPEETPVQPPVSDTVVNKNKTKSVNFSLPTDRTEQYLLGIYNNGKQVIEDTIISPDRTEIDVVLTGSGIQSYDLYINNQFYKTVKVDFDAND